MMVVGELSMGGVSYCIDDGVMGEISRGGVS